jgi:hypothetical protein
LEAGIVPHHQHTTQPCVRQQQAVRTVNSDCGTARFKVVDEIRAAFADLPDD